MIQSIDPKSLYSRLQSGEPIRIVDVRTAMEFRMGHVAGATNIPLTSIRDHIEGVAGDELIALICQSGHRSHMACQKIEPPILKRSAYQAERSLACQIAHRAGQSEPLSVSRQTAWWLA
jgi:predicted sulfurtransferase